MGDLNAAACHALPKNFLRPCLLMLLQEHPAHGYQLIERLQALGFMGEDHGRLYRALRRLEHEGHVQSEWSPSASGPYRRVYELTEVGMIALRDEVTELEAANTILDRFLCRCHAMDGDGPAALGANAVAH